MVKQSRLRMQSGYTRVAIQIYGEYYIKIYSTYTHNIQMSIRTKSIVVKPVRISN
jgi:hypothetical protein